MLKFGRTIHSTFKVPVSYSDGSSCSIAPNSQVGQEMKGIDLFILDEASMISRLVLEVIDRCLRDLTGLHNIPFCSKTFVLGGDFRQMLPIVPRGRQLVCHQLLCQKFRPLECVPTISPPAKHEALTRTGSIQQFPVATWLQ